VVQVSGHRYLERSQFRMVTPIFHPTITPHGQMAFLRYTSRANDKRYWASASLVERMDDLHEQLQRYDFADHPYLTFSLLRDHGPVRPGPTPNHLIT
jgi:hypothetical protein